MDLVSCRNLLIYLEAGLQKKAIPTFHYALRLGGFMLLGASESISGLTDLFESVDKEHKVYAKKPAPIAPLSLPLKRRRSDERSGPHPPLGTQRRSRPEPPEGLGNELTAQREADRITVNEFAPPGVLVNDELQIL